MLGLDVHDAVQGASRGASGRGRGSEAEEDGPLFFRMRVSVGSTGGSVSSGDDVFHDAEDLDNNEDDADNNAAAPDDGYAVGEDDENDDADYDLEEHVAVGGGRVSEYSAADHAATLLERSVHLCMVRRCVYVVPPALTF